MRIKNKIMSLYVSIWNFCGLGIFESETLNQITKSPELKPTKILDNHLLN